MGSKKIIKRYRNRKLYDSERSTYINLSDLRTMLREGRDVVVLDQKTQTDITGDILMHLLHETERKSRVLPSVELMRDIIRRGDGSFSGFLRTIGGFESRIGGSGPALEYSTTDRPRSDSELQAGA